MANREQLLQEIQSWGQQNPGLSPLDGIRKQKLEALKSLTGRPILVYAVDFLNPVKQQAGSLLSINLADKDHFEEIAQGISGNAIDLLIHSSGGSAEATESIVALLRSRFSDIRVLVPGTAKSAATMLAMSANQLLLDHLSELGPTDPQMVITGRVSPSGAILKQFEKAETDLRTDPTKITAWLPVLQQYGPSILIECQNHLALSKNLVGAWLAKYMFADDPDRQLRADEIASWLADDSNFLSHSRRIGVKELQEKGVKLLDLQTQPELRDIVRQLYLAIMLTFESSACFKLFENSEGVLVSLNIMLQAV